MAALNAGYGCAPMILVPLISELFGSVKPRKKVGVPLAWSFCASARSLRTLAAYFSVSMHWSKPAPSSPSACGMLGQVWPGELSLVGKESVVHLPVLALLTRAVGGLGCLEGQRAPLFDAPDHHRSRQNTAGVAATSIAPDPAESG